MVKKSCGAGMNSTLPRPRNCKTLRAAPDTPVAEALDLMMEGNFRHLPVAQDGRVVGVVSMRDLTRASRG